MSLPVQQLPSVGYFVSLSVSDFVFVGGAMVTSCQGLPIEFRYTEPVRANKLQRILYGDVLEKFIHTDVILCNLLERLEQKPQLVIVSDSEFIDEVNESGSTGVWLGETRLPKLAAIGAIQDITATEFLVQLTESGSPVRVKAVAGVSGGLSRLEIAQLLTTLAATMDLLEPLRRIEAAIQLIWEESNELTLEPAA